MTRQAEQAIHGYKQDLEAVCNGYVCRDNRTGNYVNIEDRWLQEENRIDAYAKRTGDYSIYDLPDPAYPLVDPNLSWIDTADYIDGNSYVVVCHESTRYPDAQQVTIVLDRFTSVVIDADYHGSIIRHENPSDPDPIISCKLDRHASIELYKAASQIWHRDTLD